MKIQKATEVELIKAFTCDGGSLSPKFIIHALNNYAGYTAAHPEALKDLRDKNKELAEEWTACAKQWIALHAAFEIGQLLSVVLTDLPGEGPQESQTQTGNDHQSFTA